MIVYICEMKKEEIKLLESWYPINYQNKLEGRYITPSDILPLLNNLPLDFKVIRIGRSFLKREISSVAFGKGKKKILIWTQMHGNESTGTKALFDLFQFFVSKHGLSSLSSSILNACTIVCVPILNPDGAIAYTRVNAQNIDLNRDVIDKKATESILLQKILKEVNPEYCFNMHDQRTIFSVGSENNPATISFLAPSVDKKRNITEGRKQTMEVIVSMNNLLQTLIPNQIGRYTDEFYPTATGDNFQKMGHNTILIESGHFKNDYQREMTRKYTFYALLQGLDYIASETIENNHVKYLEIPNNEKLYLDIILTNINYHGNDLDVGILFKEELKSGKIHFVPKIEKIGDLSNYNANKLIDKIKLLFSNENEINNWIKNELN